MRIEDVVTDAVLGTPIEPVVEWFRTGPEFQVFLLVVLLTLGVSRGIEFVSVEYIKGAVDRSKYDLDSVVFDELHKPLFWTVLFTGLYLATIRVSSIAPVLPSIEAVLVTVLVVIWARTLMRIGDAVTSQEATKMYGDEVDFLPIFQNIWTIGVLVAGLFVILSAWNINITPLLASAGIAGVAVGFAAKDTVANFFGSLALYFDDTYRVGDYIELESGVHGTVESVSIRSTVIRTRDDLLVTVPNSVLNSSIVTNQSAPFNFRRIRVPVSVAYGTDIDQVERILAEVAAEEDLVVDRDQFTPIVRLLQFGSDGVEYELRCWVPEPTRRTKATHMLNRAIYREFNEAGIEIPFPQRDVRLREN